MSVLTRTLIAMVVVLLQACASAPPVVSITGPSAQVSDSASGGGIKGGNFFFLAAVDDVPLKANNLGASLSASSGRGADLQIRPFQRQVAAGQRKLKLSSRFAYAAPVQSLFQSGGPPPADATLTVELLDGHTYRVTGVMDAMRRELWLEDTANGEVVGTKVSLQANDPATLKQMEGALYTCCNLRYEGDWISDANWGRLPMVPAGARIKLVDASKNRAKILVDGRPMRFGLDYGRQQITIDKLLDRLSLKDDPAPRIASWPEPVRQAVRAGQVVAGMTREQAIVALGYPRLDATPDTSATTWRYWTIQDEEYTLEWNSVGLLDRVIGSESVLRSVEFKP